MAKRGTKRAHLYAAKPYREIQARFTRNLRLVRDEIGLTQQECAERAGMLMQQYQAIESGKANVTFTTLARVVEAMGVDVSKLFEARPAVSPPEATDAPPKTSRTRTSGSPKKVVVGRRAGS